MASATGTVTVGLTGLTADIDVAAYNSGQGLLGSGTLGGTSSESFQFNVTAGQTYYLRTYQGATGAVSNYTLNTSLQTTVQLPTVTISGLPVVNEGGQLVYTVSRAGGSNAFPASPPTGVTG